MMWQLKEAADRKYTEASGRWWVVAAAGLWGLAGHMWPEGLHIIGPP